MTEKTDRKIDRAAYWAAAPKAEIIRAAEAFFGEKPNPAHSSDSELRFGTNGSKSVVLTGTNPGAYCDHESNDSGYLRLTADQYASERGTNGNRFVASAPDPEAIAKREAEAEAKRRKMRDAAMRHWRNAEGQSCAATEKYLTARLGKLPIDLADDDSPIRENVTDNQETGTAMPTMIALITEPDTGNPVAIHRTYLSETGGKADVQTAKKVLGPYRGCGVVFGPMKKSVVITEGIEDALTIARVTRKSTPIAAIAAGNMEALRLPDTVHTVGICIDEDKAGRAAAAKAARKFFDADKRVIVFRPEGAKDFNAKLQAIRAAGEAVTADSLLGEPIIGDPDADPGDITALLDFIDQHNPQDGESRHAGISDDDDHGDGGDPLEGLIEAVADDSGVAFRPAVLARLAEMKKDDRPAFESLRSQLKKAGVRVTALDEAITEESGGGRRTNQADVLVEIAEEADLFHDADGNSFADTMVKDHRETWPVRSKGFKRWLIQRYYEKTKGAPNSDALQSALSVIEAKGLYDGPEREVFIRIGGADGKIYLDLCDEEYRAAEISADSWEIVKNPPVRFRRSSGMRPLPLPVHGGGIASLRDFLNVKSEQDFILVVGWILAALRDTKPYPILVLSGEQGSAKSTFAAVMRALVDPNMAGLRSLPREDRDMYISTIHSWALVFDNVSALPVWLSDSFCKMSTGGALATRALFTDQEEVLFEATRPVVLNGIEDFVTRPDLADRAIFLTLSAIPEEARRSEVELWAAFNASKAEILGALLTAVSVGLKKLPDTTLTGKPRMADFALWVTACETAFWPAGTFMTAYADNRADAVENVIEADPVATAIRALMNEKSDEWDGTASDLLTALSEIAGERVTKSKAWPGSARALSGRLRRAATFLRKIGIEVQNLKLGKSRTRTIVISAAPIFSETEKGGNFASASSAPSAKYPQNVTNPLKSLDNEADANAPLADANAAEADANAPLADANAPHFASAPIPLKENDKTAADAKADGADAKIRAETASEKTDTQEWSGKI